MNGLAEAARLRTESPRRSRADDVYARLKADIGDFGLVPGDRFTEAEVSERLGVSRTPVRQALFRLQQEGYVEVQFRSGWRVLPFDFERFEQLYDLRTVFECEAVRRLCRRPAPAVRASLATQCALWLVPEPARSQDPAEVGRWDETFHCTLVAAAGNAEMARAHREVTERIRIVRRLDFTKPARVTATYEEHAAILRAVLAGDAVDAVARLTAHIGASQAEVRSITLHQMHLARRVPA